MTIRRRTLLHATGAVALAAAAPARAAEKIRITLWHAMAATPGDEINKLMAAFNASQDQVEVTGLFKGV
jgi:ABC-type glycerol-3-phosphate transport system substrate-binding protein